MQVLSAQVFWDSKIIKNKTSSQRGALRKEVRLSYIRLTASDIMLCIVILSCGQLLSKGAHNRKPAVTLASFSKDVAFLQENDGGLHSGDSRIVRKLKNILKVINI